MRFISPSAIIPKVGSRNLFILLTAVLIGAFAQHASAATGFEKFAGVYSVKGVDECTVGNCQAQRIEIAASAGVVCITETILPLKQEKVCLEEVNKDGLKSYFVATDESGASWVEEKTSGGVNETRNVGVKAEPNGPLRLGFKETHASGQFKSVKVRTYVIAK